MCSSPLPFTLNLAAFRTGAPVHPLPRGELGESGAHSSPWNGRGSYDSQVLVESILLQIKLFLLLKLTF